MTLLPKEKQSFFRAGLPSPLLSSISKEEKHPKTAFLPLPTVERAFDVTKKIVVVVNLSSPRRNNQEHGIFLYENVFFK